MITYRDDRNRSVSLFVVAVTLSAAVFPGITHASETLDPSEATIAQLQSEIAAGRLTSVQLVDYFLARIEAIDRNGPKLNSIIETNPDARAIAVQLDAERRKKHVRGPLHGIPILLKDNIDTADQMATTAGSLALLGPTPTKDAFIVRRLRAAGAIILGKTNMSEWAHFRSRRSASAWSGRGGLTRNPYALDRNACGSSSGSGAAIAAGLAVVAVGTETDGSVVCPSGVNGIVGIKPTIGMLSRSGIIPISASQDTAGPMARTVADAAILLAAMSGVDINDATTVDASTTASPLTDRATSPTQRRTRKLAHKPLDFAASLHPDGLKGVRIGVARNLAGFHPEVDAVLNRAIGALTAAGAIVVDPTDLKLPDTLGADEYTVFLYEFKDGLNRYLATRPGVPQTLADLIAFNERERVREMPYFGQIHFERAQEKGSLTDSAYIQARGRSLAAAGRDGIDAVLAKYSLDAIIAPTNSPAWTTDLVNGDNNNGGDISTAPAVAGYPHITVPAGFVHGLPIGLSFVGAAWSEPKLIAYAYAFEQATHARRPPTFPEHAQ